MKQEFGELVGYLDKKFTTIDQRFDAVDKRFDVVAKEIVSFRNDTEHRFESLENNFRQLQHSVDAYAAKADNYFMEMAALSNKINRLEKWIEEIAEKVGIKLKS